MAGGHLGVCVVTAAVLERPQTSARRDWTWLALLWCVVTAYNLFKPFHIDDAAHLIIAQWIANHPLHPMTGVLNWSGVDEPIYRTNQPHLYFYLLAFWGRIFGFSEPAMHALQSVASAACIAFFYRLARRIVGPQAIWATAMLVLSPAVIVEQNLMVDVPLLAIWLAFFNPLVCDADSPHQTRRYVLVAVACALAVLTKYSSLVLVPILCLSLVLERRRGQAWTVLIPLVTLLAWSGFNYLDYGGVHLVERQIAPFPVAWRPVKFTIAWLLALGAVTPLGFIAALQSRATWRRTGWVYALPIAALLALAFAVASGAVTERAGDWALWVGFMGNAVLIVLALIPEAYALIRAGFWRPDVAQRLAPQLYLGLWIGAASAFYILFSPFIAARHVLLILPPITLLLVYGWSTDLSRSAKVSGLAMTLLVSAGLGLSDWRFAAFYRDEARSVTAQARPGAGVWIEGHWGFQWYGLERGGREVDIGASLPAPGDVVAIGAIIPHENFRAPPPLLPVRIDRQTGPLLDLFCTARPWGLYISSSKFAPWSLSRHCLGQVEVLRVGSRPEQKAR